MSRLALAFVVHNHQPVGNFDHVIENGYRQAYLPFLELLERRPNVRIALHNSGCLWEWLEKNHPEYGERVAVLVRRGQVELLGGGFYEPILPLLPLRDRRGQIERMGRFLQDRFGVAPKGIWLAERAWEQHLASDLAAEGIEYLCLDDTQFLQVGLQDDDLRGYYLTEDAGASVALYPIQMRLRYAIPFAPPERVIEVLRASADDRPGNLCLFADDGEKFGIWPGTHALCYGERWLDRFFDSLDCEDGWLRLLLPGEHRAENPPLGRIYLPAGSYREMTEWALPPSMRSLFDETQEFLRSQGREEAERLLLKGGFFRNFIARYSEANQMHKRVLFTLGRLRSATDMPGDSAAQVLDHLWRAQSNDAYWHGVFGGLYLPHLRDGIYRELLLGEAVLERHLRGPGAWVDAQVVDYDCDGDPEVILTSDRLGLYISPRRGGGLLEIDDRAGARNLVNSLTRRPEAYHAQLGAGSVSEDGAARTIHDRITSKQEDLERFLVYDRWERVALVDRFFLHPPDPNALTDGGMSERGDFAGSPYRLDSLLRLDGVEVRLSRKGCLDNDPGLRLEVHKSVRLRAGEDRFEVRYRLRSLADSVLRFSFGVEWLVNLLAGDAPDRFVLVDGVRPQSAILAGEGVHGCAESISLVDGWAQERIDLTAQGASGWVRAPVETVSLSEAGAERLYQGTIVMPYWERVLEPGAEWGTVLGLSLRHGPEVVEPGVV